MRGRFRRPLSIGQNLALSAFFQVTAIVVVLFFAYFSRLDEIRKDLDERGALIATAIAENSQYGIVSGNHAYLYNSLHHLLASNNDIYSISVRDKSGADVASLRSNAPEDAEKREYRSTVTMASTEVNLIDFDSSGASGPAVPASKPAQTSKVIGDVVVTLSAANMLAQKRNKLLIGIVLAAGFLLLSIVDGLRRSQALTRPLIDTVAAIREIREGSYSVRFESQAGPELSELQEGIVSMAERLREFHQGLEDLVLARTRELEKTRDEALRASAERKLLIQKVSSAAEAERHAIAVEIHDHLNALVVVARLEAKAIVKLAKRMETQLHANKGKSSDNAEGPTELDQRTANLMKTVTDLYQMGRDIIKRLRPEVIETLGLDAAVSEIVSGYNTLYPGCRFHYRSSGDFLRMDSKVALSAYRLIQESISNIVKHAEASEVHVHLRLSECEQMLSIAVIDNGRGFDMQNYQAGIGLIGMRERLSTLGGTLDIESSPGNGTAIRAEFSVQLS